MISIDREQLKQMMDEDAVTVVEVLDEPYFKKFHLPDAINVPVSGDFDKAIQSAIPDKSQPVAVYCQDSECPASPQAGKRMEELGYKKVYDYEAGKADWKDADFPIET